MPDNPEPQMPFDEIPGWSRHVYPSGIIRYTPNRLHVPRERPPALPQWGVLHWVGFAAACLLIAWLTAKGVR